MIYFDNAATSYPKPRSVTREVNRCIRDYCGNPGRSSHRLSLKAAEKIYSVREAVSSLLGADSPESCVFTLNATYAINLAIKSIIKPNCHVLTSDFEHNSVIRPLERLKREAGIRYTSFSDVQEIEGLIREDTRAIVCSVASNVSGETLSLKTLSQIAKNHQLKLIVDASQYLGHGSIDLKDTPCDAVCAPAHKALLGIQGCGFVFFKSNEAKLGLVEGGSGFDSINPRMPDRLPEGYEAGTPPTPAIAGLGRGIEFINKVGVSDINKKLQYLTDEAYERLISIKGVRVYGRGSGIISFNLKNIPSSILSEHLSSFGICVRGGLHCAPSVHKKLNTLEQGAVRLSFSYFNSKREVDVFYKRLKEILKTI